ncbi:MAG: DNA repair exonuclease [Desulfobulbaceae bacterium]|nr:DNA repair exonuclease [Desulfobulbaceae bacterium]
MFRFIHAADIHIDSPLRGLEAHDGAPVEEIRGATRRAFDNLIEWALEEEVAFVLIAGDLYDGDWKDYNTGLFFVNRIGRLQKAGIKVFIVAGNHDAATNMTKSLPLPSNVTFFSADKSQSFLLAEHEVVIHGRSYSGRVVSDNLALGYPQAQSGYFNIGLLHTSLTGREGHEVYAPCSIDDLKSKDYDYWALGHVHQREIVSRDPWIVFPGNIQGRHVREEGAKGAFLVTVEEGRVSEIIHHDLDVLRWSVPRIDISDLATISSLHEQIRTVMEETKASCDNKPLALRLILEGQSALHAELHGGAAQVLQEIRGISTSLEGIWLEKVQFDTSREALSKEVNAEKSPLSGLLHTIANFTPGDEPLTALIPELGALKSKLPPGILEADSLLGKSDDKLAELLPEIKEILIAKLTRHET